MVSVSLHSNSESLFCLFLVLHHHHHHPHYRLSYRHRRWFVHPLHVGLNFRFTRFVVLCIANPNNDPKSERFAFFLIRHSLHLHSVRLYQHSPRISNWFGWLLFCLHLPFVRACSCLPIVRRRPASARPRPLWPHLDLRWPQIVRSLVCSISRPNWLQLLFGIFLRFRAPFTIQSCFANQCFVYHRSTLLVNTGPPLIFLRCFRPLIRSGHSQESQVVCLSIRHSPFCILNLV